MDKRKQARIDQARLEAAERTQKAIVSLAHCLGRSDVYRIHHDALVHEMLDAGGIEAFSDVKKLRFAAYVSAWFAGLSGVIERFEQLVGKGTLPQSDELSRLITPAFVDVIRPFRNAVSHCSDHDDDRVLQFLGAPDVVPDDAAAISSAFKRYFQTHSTRDLYPSESAPRSDPS